jgi:hypothetical protein
LTFEMNESASISISESNFIKSRIWSSEIWIKEAFSSWGLRFDCGRKKMIDQMRKCAINETNLNKNWTQKESNPPITLWILSTLPSCYESNQLMMLLISDQSSSALWAELN